MTNAVCSFSHFPPAGIFLAPSQSRSVSGQTSLLVFDLLVMTHDIFFLLDSFNAQTVQMLLLIQLRVVCFYIYEGAIPFCIIIILAVGFSGKNNRV